MKRYGNLYPEIVDFENILLAAKQAQRGKRFRENVLAFNYNLEGELTKLQQELINKTYQPGTYRTFYIKEPKSRMISAAPYRDRVVHHALCNVIVPIIEPTFIGGSKEGAGNSGCCAVVRGTTILKTVVLPIATGTSVPESAYGNASSVPKKSPDLFLRCW
jgi:hypothetical protein